MSRAILKHSAPRQAGQGAVIDSSQGPVNTGERNNLKPPELSCNILASTNGPLAQLGERLVRNQEVGGSIPPRSTKPFNNLPGRSLGESAVCYRFATTFVRGCIV